jgi:hypothetical protein
MKKSLLAVLLFTSAAFCFAQDNWLSLGGRLGGSVHFYKPGDDMYEGHDVDSHFSFDGAVQAAVNISDIFAVQTELLFTRDAASVTERDGGYVGKVSCESTSLLIPVLVKASFRPGNFVLSGIAGIYFTVPLGDMKVKYTLGGGGYNESGSTTGDFEKAPLGFMIGANGGIKLGPGNLFADLRYAMDFGETEGSFQGSTETVSLYKRSMFMFFLGYEIGLIGKGGGGGVYSGGGGRRR